MVTIGGSQRKPVPGVDPCLQLIFFRNSFNEWGLRGGGDSSGRVADSANSLCRAAARIASAGKITLQ
jgi:hypothetical protein